MAGLSEVTAIATNGSSSFALKSDGTVWAWGINNSGQLGNGGTSDSSTPVRVIGLTGVQAIAAGAALKRDGTVWAWGSNSNGQLGDGAAECSLSFSAVPVQVKGIDGVAAINTNNGHSTAVKRDGTVWAWGDRAYSSSQMMRPVNGPHCTTSPVQVDGLDGITAVTSGTELALALKNDGTVWSWGTGRLGHASRNQSNVPAQVAGLDSVQAIAAGFYFSHVVKTDGTVWGWGYNRAGQLGIGTGIGAGNDAEMPVQALINLLNPNFVTRPYQGLWWNPPEPGWGISITQHGPAIFAAWYSFDYAGLPLWYVMSSCVVSGPACSGDIYQVNGGSPPEANWNDSEKIITKVGTGNLFFSDANSARLSYRLHNADREKSLTRQVFAHGSTPPSLDYSDLWWNPAEPGWGIALTQQFGTIFASWYTFDATGAATWFVVSRCPLSGNGCSGDLYQVTGGSAPTTAWDGAAVKVNRVGTASLAFTEGGVGSLSYTINGVGGSKPIRRQAF